MKLGESGWSDTLRVQRLFVGDSGQELEPAFILQVWQNVERVLVALPEHDRLKHFDMGEFLTETDCGTVGCAAGLASLDPWFRAHRFGSHFEEHINVFGELRKCWRMQNDAWPMPTFFGEGGNKYILHDMEQRPAEEVIEEVREHIQLIKDEAFKRFGLTLV